MHDKEGAENPFLGGSSPPLYGSQPSFLGDMNPNYHMPPPSPLFYIEVQCNLTLSLIVVKRSVAYLLNVAI